MTSNLNTKEQEYFVETTKVSTQDDEKLKNNIIDVNKELEQIIKDAENLITIKAYSKVVGYVKKQD